MFNNKYALPGVVGFIVASIFVPFGIIALPVYCTANFFNLLNMYFFEPHFENMEVNILVAQLSELVYHKIGVSQLQIFAFVALLVSVGLTVFYYRNSDNIDFKRVFSLVTLRNTISFVFVGGIALFVVCAVSGVMLEQFYFSG